MLRPNTQATTFQINHYYNERVAVRKNHVHKTVHMIAKIVQEILKEVEALEPRFISTLVETNGRYEGVYRHNNLRNKKKKRLWNEKFSRLQSKIFQKT